MLYYKKGTTLNEVLVVVAIASVLASIAYPQYNRYIRQGKQLEAKANLGVVYQKQLSYLSSELKFSKSLKEIGAVPVGPIRYNIGTDWTTGNHTEDTFNQDNSSSDPCPCNDSKGAGLPAGSCWADPNPEGTGDCSAPVNKKCYGGVAPTMAGRLSNLSPPMSPIPTGGFDVTGGKFEYYAIGCTSPSYRDNDKLDVWSINHKKNLKNIRPGF
ncbi:MAG: prepilin-type N-terminal cleavage/methylation domain-containing protein [Bdellovibrionales bacterium]|nr:prepilin-type N-terminal cleavage/methylation domain-containing protein [Bdellovibrionales bacterium]